MATERARERVRELLGEQRAAWVREEGASCEPGSQAIVLDGGLAPGDRAMKELRRIGELLAPDGMLIAAVPCARGQTRLARALRDGLSTRDGGGFTRRSLLDVLDAGGWDVAALEPVRDHAVEWVPLPVTGTISLDIGPAVLKDLTADDVEELTAEAFVAVGRRRPAATPSCSIVVTACGELALTEKCLSALLDHPPAASHEIVVVDDGSADGTADHLAAIGDRVRVVHHDAPSGFAAAANRGVMAATGEFVAIVHNDAVVAPGALDSLIEALRLRPAAGCAGAKLVFPDGRLGSAGLAIGPELLPYPLYRGRPVDAPEAGRLREVPALSSACLVVRRRWLVEVGAFDEALSAFEDADLCLRLRARGRPALYCPAATVVHREGATPGPRTLLRDAAYFGQKWAGRVASDDEALCEADGTDVRRARALGWYMPRRGRPRPDPDAPPPVLLSGQIFGRSGYANEIRAYALALERQGVLVRANPAGWPLEERDRDPHLWRLATDELPREFVHLCTFVALQLHPHPWALANVGRTMWETDRVPPDRLERCAHMDEIWVPGQQQLELFAASGFPRERLVAIPETFDVGLYDKPPPPAAIEGAEGFVYLSVMTWTRRKGWDVLVQAYVEEFDPAEDVTLVIAYRPFGFVPDDHPFDELHDHVLRTLGRSLAACPRIVMLPMQLPQEAMPALYGAADAFVLASRGEGWGRPLMEAMASGLPTIGTRWSGNMEFMSDDNSFLVDYDLVDVSRAGWNEWREFRGQRWAEPRVADLRAALRRVKDDPDEAQARARRARREIHERYGPGPVGRLMVDRLRALVS